MKNSKNKGHSINVIAGIVGILVLFLIFLGIGYVRSGKAEMKINQFNNYHGPRGTIVEGLTVNFKEKDVHCFGLVSFECYIDNIDVLLEGTKTKVAKIKQIQIGTLTNNGFKSGMNTYFDVQVIGLDLSDNSELTKNISETGKRLKEMLTPFDIGLKINMKEFKSGDQEGVIDVSYSSDIMDFSLSGDLLITTIQKSVVYIDKNLTITRDKKKAVAERVFNQGISNILKSFTVKIKNKNLNNFMYDSYVYYYEKLTSNKDKEYLNISLIGYIGSDLVSKERFTKEVSDRMNALIPYYDDKQMTDYLGGVDKIISHNSGSLTVKVKNKENYTLEELTTADKMDTFTQNQLKFFEISTTYNK